MQEYLFLIGLLGFSGFVLGRLFVSRGLVKPKASKNIFLLADGEPTYKEPVVQAAVSLLRTTAGKLELEELARPRRLFAVLGGGFLVASLVLPSPGFWWLLPPIAGLALGVFLRYNEDSEDKVALNWQEAARTIVQAKRSHAFRYLMALPEPQRSKHIKQAFSEADSATKLELIQQMRATEAPWPKGLIEAAKVSNLPKALAEVLVYLAQHDAADLMEYLDQLIKKGITQPQYEAIFQSMGAMPDVARELFMLHALGSNDATLNSRTGSFLQNNPLMDAAFWQRIHAGGSGNQRMIALQQLAKSDDSDSLAFLEQVAETAKGDEATSALLALAERKPITYLPLLTEAILLDIAKGGAKFGTVVLRLAGENLGPATRGKALEMLLALLASADTQIVTLAASKLETYARQQGFELIEAATGRLTALLEMPAFQLAYCKLIGAAAYNGAMPFLQQMLGSEHEHFRQEAIKAMVAINPQQAVPALVRMAKSDTPALRTYSHEQLLRIPDSRAFPYLRERYEDMRTTLSTTNQFTLRPRIEAVETALQAISRYYEPWIEHQATLFCKLTLRRPRLLKYKVGGNTYNFLELPGGNFDLTGLVRGVLSVVGYIGGLPGSKKAGYFVPYWDEATKTVPLADLDYLYIEPSASPVSYDWAINSAVQQLQNQGIKQLEVVIHPGLELSENARRLLATLAAQQKN